MCHSKHFSIIADEKHSSFLFYGLISCVLLALIQLPASVLELLVLYAFNATQSWKGMSLCVLGDFLLCTYLCCDQSFLMFILKMAMMLSFLIELNKSILFATNFFWTATWFFFLNFCYSFLAWTTMVTNVDDILSKCFRQEKFWEIFTAVVRKMLSNSIYKQRYYKFKWCSIGFPLAWQSI